VRQECAQAVGARPGRPAAPRPIGLAPSDRLVSFEPRHHPRAMRRAHEPRGRDAEGGPKGVDCIRPPRRRSTAAARLSPAAPALVAVTRGVDYAPTGTNAVRVEGAYSDAAVRPRSAAQLTLTAALRPSPIHGPPRLRRWPISRSRAARLLSGAAVPTLPAELFDSLHLWTRRRCAARKIGPVPERQTSFNPAQLAGSGCISEAVQECARLRALRLL